MAKTFLDRDENLFSYVVKTFKSSASISLGKTQNPVTKKVDINLLYNVLLCTNIFEPLYL